MQKPANHGRSAGIQTRTADRDSAASNSGSASLSPTYAGKALLTFAEAGELLGVCERKARDIVPGLATPVVLGPRCVRIVRAELEAAVANLPRRTDPVEPVQLLKARVAKLKRDGVAA